LQIFQVQIQKKIIKSFGKMVTIEGYENIENGKWKKKQNSYLEIERNCRITKLHLKKKSKRLKKKIKCLG